MFYVICQKNKTGTIAHANHIAAFSHMTVAMLQVMGRAYPMFYVICQKNKTGTIAHTNEIAVFSHMTVAMLQVMGE